MVLEKETRRNVDVVEADFREFKIKYPEEFEKIVKIFEATTENTYKNLPFYFTELGDREKDRASRLAP